MTKFRVLLSRPERAFIYFSIQSFTANHLKKEEFEGLRLCYLATLLKIYRRGFDLFRLDDIYFSFTLAEIGALYQMTHEQFDTLVTTEAVTAARGIIWKMHPLIMRNSNKLKYE